MGKKSLHPWLADCVWHELAAVVTWKKELNTGVKKDPESRFEDDGSNFRSRSSGHEQCLVQLIEVLSPAEPVKVILSDGVTKVKAQLSSNIVSTLEAETEETFGSEVTGDVFQLRNFTVISTILGPADDFVQLAVDEIEYEHHLRKVQGHPQPIEEDENVALLLQDITNLRHPSDAEERTIMSSYGSRIPPHQAHRHASTLMPSTQSQYLPSGIQSQYPASRKRPMEPTLAKEGLQIAEGINLSKPLRTTSGPPASKGPPAGKASMLLDLLGKQNQTRETLPLPSPQAENGRKRAREDSPPPLPTISTESPARQPPTSSGRVAETPAKLNKQPAERLVEFDPESEEQTRSNDPRLFTHSASNRSPPSAQPPPQSTNTKSSGSSGQPRVPYGRRKVPANQRKLLDDKSSWIPSFPGYRFPAPNVPIELLTKWNKTAKPSPQKPRATQKTQPSPAQRSESPMDAPMDDDDAVQSSAASITSSDSDAAEFGSDQWPPSQRRPELPPDSSWDDENIIQGTQQDDLEVAVPRALPTRKSSSNIPARPQQASLRQTLPPRPSVEIPSQAALDSVLASYGTATQQTSPPDSSFSASHPAPPTNVPQSSVGATPHEAIQAPPSQPQVSSQRAEVLPRGSQVSAVSSRPAIRPPSQAPSQVSMQADISSPAGRLQTQQVMTSNSPASASPVKSSAGDISYMESGFDLNSLSAPKVRRLLVAHDVDYPPSAGREHLVELFHEKLGPKARRLPGQAAHHTISQRPSDQATPVQPQASRKLSHTSPPAAIRTLSKADQVHSDPADTRRKLAELESKKRPRTESSAQVQVHQSVSTNDTASPNTTNIQESPPRSSFRNPAMVGRRSPTAQSSPLATPLQRQTPASDVAKKVQNSQHSSPKSHEAVRLASRSTSLVHPSAPVQPSHPTVTADISDSQSFQQQSPTPRNATRLAMPSGPSVPSVKLQTQYPDELHRLARREHFDRSGRREKWIKDHYERVNHGNKTVVSMLEMYKTEHPEDNVTDLEQITRAAMIVFRSSREALANAKFRKVNLPAVPTSSVKEVTPDAQSFSRAHTRHSSRRGGDSTPVQLGESNQRAAPSPSPRGARRAKAGPIMQIDGANIQAHVVPSTQTSTAADDHDRSTLDERVAETVMSKSTSDALKEFCRNWLSIRPGGASTLDERVAETVMSDSTSDALKEFCRNWLSIRPGGAFATPQPARPKSRRKVDVLRWDI